jgi:hypothetical protein
MVTAMASPAPSHDRGAAAPAADPVEIQACLPQQLVVEFDAEWDIVLEKAKSSRDLAGVHSLLHKWRHLAYAELRDPGSCSRLPAKTEEILRTGTNSTAGSYTQMRALIQERLGQ